MIDFVDLEKYCEGLHEKVSMEYPFGPQTLTPKIGNKIFCFISLDSNPPSISIKADPENVAELKESKSASFDSKYLNKKHWVGVVLNEDISSDEILTLIGDSFSLVKSSLTKKAQAELDQ